MFDSSLRPFIDVPLNRCAELLAHSKVSPNTITWFGFTLGIGAAISIVCGFYYVALALILGNRVLDGLDGALARIKGPTNYGGFLDIVLDFLFYSFIPLAFIIANPIDNAIAGSFLIFSFVGTGTSFLAYAIIAEKLSISTDIRGEKSFYYLGGLTEGFETILLFVFICLLPAYFHVFAWCFGGLCWVTTITRIMAAKKNFF